MHNHQSLIPTNSSEFLIHAADVEGLCEGIDQQLVESEFLSPFHNRDATNFHQRAGRMG